LIHFK